MTHVRATRTPTRVLLSDRAVCGRCGRERTVRPGRVAPMCQDCRDVDPGWGTAWVVVSAGEVLIPLRGTQDVTPQDATPQDATDAEWAARTPQDAP